MSTPNSKFGACSYSNISNNNCSEAEPNYSFPALIVTKDQCVNNLTTSNIGFPYILVHTGR